MSADNWTECPKCNIPWTANDFEKKQFREDFSIGIENGIFKINYQGKCETCGFQHEFKHQKLLNASIAPPEPTESHSNGDLIAAFHTTHQYTEADQLARQAGFLTILDATPTSLWLTFQEISSIYAFRSENSGWVVTKANSTGLITEEEFFRISSTINDALNTKRLYPLPKETLTGEL